VHAVLKREGESVSRKRVERLMRQAGITGIAPTRKIRTTVANPADQRSDDLVGRKFTALGPNRLWVTDLTVISTGEGPLWLASIRDVFSRKIVAWETSDTADADLVCAVLEYALRSRRPEKDDGLIHHADHGAQYTSIKLTTRLLRSGIRASMGTVGDSFDNALAENFWSVAKTECVRRREFATRAEANQALFEYIDLFYNTRRIQKNLGWRSPDEFEAAHHAGDLTEADYTRLADAAERRRTQRCAARQAKLSSVAQPTIRADATGPDTAGAPGGVAGSDPDTPATPRRSDRAERPAPIPTSPRERRGPGQRPDTAPTSHNTAAKRVRPSGRTLTTTEKSRSKG
jgi:transposase InsO family protein